MDNFLAIPMLNPMFVVDKSRSILPQYHSKFDDEFLDNEVRKLWQGAGRYFQKWQTNDVIRFQFMCNVSPIKLAVYDCNGLRKGAILEFTQVRRNRYNNDLWVYEASLALNDIPKGVYRIEITVGDPVIETFETDWFAVATDWPNTVLIEYKCSYYYGDIIFATGYAPTFRVEGWFKKGAPVSKDESYTDQVQNQRLIFSDPYTVRKFIVGPPPGVPDWMDTLLNWIVGCDETYYDGKAMAKMDGAKWETEEIEGHPFHGLAISLQDQNRRTSRIFPIDPAVGGKKLLVAANTETEGFADTTTGASSNVIQITQVET